MKIGIFTDAYKPLISGVATSISMLKEGLEELGHEVTIITMFPPDKKHIETDPSVVRLKGFKIPSKSLKYFRYSFRPKKLYKKVKDYNFDIIHIHTEFTVGKVGLRYLKNHNVPMIYTIHTFYEEYIHHVSKFMDKVLPKTSRKIVHNITKKYTTRARYTILPTNKVLDSANRLGYPGNFKIIPTGIELKPFYKETYDSNDIYSLRQSLGIVDNEFVYIIVARIAKEKTIEDLIYGFKKHLIEYPNSKFLIIGDGPAKKDLEKIIEKNKLSKNILMLGFVPWKEVGRYYQLADAFLNASTSETQGLTYIEAMASNLAMIVRYDNVLDGVIFDYENGIFFNTIDDLVSKMKLIRDDNALFNKLKDNSRNTVETYSKENYAKNVLALYEKAIKAIK